MTGKHQNLSYLPYDCQLDLFDNLYNQFLLDTNIENGNKVIVYMTQ